jgi:hypothetical protein
VWHAHLYTRQLFLFSYEPEDYRRLHNRLNGLYHSLKTIQVDKFGRMLLSGHIACMGDRTGAYSALMEKDHFQDLGLDGRIILKFISRKWMERSGLDCSGSGQGQVAATCECGYEPSGSIKCGELID